MMPDFNRLTEVHDRCRKAQISYTMHYNESENSFSFDIISAAPSEEFLGRDRSYDIAVDAVLEHLRKIKT